MLSVDAWLNESKAPARMIMQVHDELVFEVANDAIDSVCAEVRQRMESVAQLSVPLLVEIGDGMNWDEAH
jgi:DNA polymerase-1